MRSLIAAGISVCLVGCVVTSTEIVRTPAGVAASRGAVSAPASSAGEHIVVRGETLYSIAFRRGLDWRDLANWNGLGAPYTIYPGQRLHLGARGVSSSTAATREASARPPASGAAETRPLANTTTGPAASTTTNPPTAAKPPSSAQTRPAEPQPLVSPPPSQTPPDTTVAVTEPPLAASAEQSIARDDSAPTVSVAGIRWRWPTQGEVIQRFTNSDLTRQGIDIAGRSGQAVVAAADGEVVYSGSGLRGYGELIIVKHSAEFLSAYGHNRKRLVAEGQRVKAGEPIAELGRTGTDRDKLHFEIRRNGKPVDPMQFLPKS